MNQQNGAAMAGERWLPTKEAAAMLGVSPRELQRKVVAYPRQFRRRQERDGRRTLALYNEQDLREFLERTGRGIDPAAIERKRQRQIWNGRGIDPDVIERGSPQNSPQALQRAGGVVEAQLVATGGEIAAWDALATRLSERPPAILTLREAAAEYKIPVPWLRKQCESGTLGRNVGTDTRRIWRISRRQLEELFEVG